MAMSKMSAKNRRLRKEMMRIIKADRFGNCPSTRFVVALVLLARPDVGRIAEIADVCTEDANLFAKRLRKCRVIHGDRLDLSGLFSGFDGPSASFGMVVSISLMALACAGKLEQHKPCKHCGGPTARDGYQRGVQRWLCRACGKPFVYHRNPLERMRAPWEDLEKAVALAKKGTPSALVASRTSLSSSQAEKVGRLVNEGYDLRGDLRTVYGSGSTKSATAWSPVALDLYKIVA